MSEQWMIYGAYGFTGELIAHHAVEQGESPLLAGRDAERTAALAHELGLDHVAASLDDEDALHKALSRVDAVVHAAGPFSRTSAKMVAACLATGTHYLDITGEIAVFNAVFKAHDAAVEAGVVLLPGVGFDVIPTDGMAALLHRELPDAVSLDLAFAGLGSASQGTMRTALEGISQGGWIREDGRLKNVPTGWQSQEVDFADKRRNVVTIPWGDLATAYRSTGIPNIRTWMAIPRSAARWMRYSNPFKGLLGSGAAQGLMSRWIDRQERGPDAQARATGRSEVWGRVVNDAGQSVEGTLTAPEGYRLTALGAVASVKRVAQATPGAHTPSSAFGADFAGTIEGITVHSTHRKEPSSSRA
jgi:saccharopine dehydrogenase (NAD+, L-lysine-forming)